MTLRQPSYRLFLKDIIMTEAQLGGSASFLLVYYVLIFTFVFRGYFHEQ